jgi:hypothetical protein
VPKVSVTAGRRGQFVTPECDSERPALEAAREVHLHFHGVDPADVAEILRHERPE